MGKNKRKKIKVKHKPTYPKTVEECIDDSLKYRKATLDAVNEFKRTHPWKGTRRERRAKIVHLHRHLCEIYGRDIGITFDPHGKSQYIPAENIIVLEDLSVVTFLHEFAHALGRDEAGACRWSLNLFKRCFPKSFAKTAKVGHLVVRNNIISSITDAAMALIQKRRRRGK